MIGWKLPALLASIIMVGINLLCYNVFNIISNEGISLILILLIQPGMIYAYSKLIHDVGNNIVIKGKPGPKIK